MLSMSLYTRLLGLLTSGEKLFLALGPYPGRYNFDSDCNSG